MARVYDRHRHRGGRARHHRQRPDRAPASTREFIPVANDDLTWDQADAASLAVWDEADKTITERAGAILAADTTRAPRVSFVYLGAVDFAGHAAGAGDAYRTARR